ncbi:MAG: NAD(P)/FAD-dependent oxidoreductase [Holosporales bacterium]
MIAHPVHETDVAIIGAGPVGLFAAFECGMMRLRCHLIDALDTWGGQCAALYPEKPIYDIPGFSKVDGAELVQRLYDQAAPFNPTYHLDQQVEQLQRTPDDRWQLVTSKGVVIVAKVVVIAAGVGAFGPNRPPLDHLEDYEGKSVHYYVKRREDFRGKRIVIAGGGDSAVDWALSLAEVAEHIYVVHRRAKFRAAPESTAQLERLAQDNKIELVIPYQLHGLKGRDGVLEAVEVATLEGDIKTLEADTLLPFFGLATSLGPITAWGLNFDKSTIAIDPLTTATNLPGVFAIGDVATYPHKLKLILCGFSEAAQAAHQARKVIYPDEAWHFEYSTTSGVPRA